MHFAVFCVHFFSVQSHILYVSNAIHISQHTIHITQLLFKAQLINVSSCDIGKSMVLCSLNFMATFDTVDCCVLSSF